METDENYEEHALVQHTETQMQPMFETPSTSFVYQRESCRNNDTCLIEEK